MLLLRGKQSRCAQGNARNEDRVRLLTGWGGGGVAHRGELRRTLMHPGGTGFRQSLLKTATMFMGCGVAIDFYPSCNPSPWMKSVLCSKVLRGVTVYHAGMGG